MGYNPSLLKTPIQFKNLLENCLGNVCTSSTYQCVPAAATLVESAAAKEPSSITILLPK
jgi:hypothetical protein